MTSQPASSPPAWAITHVVARRRATAEILDGRLPSLAELYRGLPCRHGDLQSDAATWAGLMLAEDQIDDPQLRGELELLRAQVTLGVMLKIRASLARLGELFVAGRYTELTDEAPARAAFYAVMLGGLSRHELISTVLTLPANDTQQRAENLVFALGIASTFRTDLFRVNDAGTSLIERAAACIYNIQAAEAVLDARPSEIEPEPMELADAMMALAEDRSELLFSRAPKAATLQVVPAAPAGLLGNRRDAWKSFADIAGKALPLVPAGGVVAHSIALQVRFPHARMPIQSILRDLSTSDVARFRPTLLVGSPGCGKTSLARAIGDVIGIPSLVYNAGGMADASLAGTSAQWSTARPSVALELVRSSAVANPLVVLDEIDKVGTSRRNGSLVDALLGFLEPSTASRIYDLALEVTVDLSAVIWIATANRLDDVPAALRDRFRVIDVEEPRWEHVGDLAQGILNDIAAERGIDRRWLDDLAADELAVLKRAWSGGSIRRLRRAIEVLVDGRDALMGRA